METFLSGIAGRLKTLALHLRTPVTYHAIEVLAIAIQSIFADF